MTQVEVARRGGPSWTLRLYGALPVGPASAGAVLALALIAGFLGSELALGRLTAGRDVRLAIVHCLLVAYLPTAYVYVLRWSRRTLRDLRPALDCSEVELSQIASAVGTYPWWGLVLTALAMVGLSAGATIETTDPNVGPWAWSQLTPEVRWHRILSPILSWWGGCLLYAVVVESHRVSRLADRLGPIDILDLRPLSPLARHAIGNALLIVGAVSIFSLSMLESGFLAVVTRAWIGAALAASMALVLAMIGAHRKIRAAKQRELDWCREALQRARDDLKEGVSHGGRLHMQEITTYEQVVEGVREWPLDTPALVRFAFYLLIPLGSWSLGAVGERVIEALLQ